MTWTGDQLPWNVKFSKPPRPSQQWEPLNYFPGPTPLIRGKGASSLTMQILRNFPGSPVLCRGPVSAIVNLETVYHASPTFTTGMAGAVSSLKYFPGTPVLSGAPVPIIAAKLQRFLAHP